MKRKNLKFIICSIGSHKLAFPIKNVKEILQAINFDIKKIPGLDNKIVGVVQLRDQGLSIIDLRNFFGGKSLEIKSETCIAVVKYGKEVYGFIMDSAENLVSLSEIGGTQIPYKPAEKTLPFVDNIISEDSLEGNTLIHFLNIKKLFKDVTAK